ncbi:MAG TPA: 6-pyruvoyl-tetrahydropterin synthase-related protein [Nitrospiria bacterium]
MKKEPLIDLSFLLIIFAFLFTYFDPKLLFLKTIVTGGDTASHYYTAQYLREELLPKGKIIGWLPGNYAGFPLFQFYFPLPFVIAVILSLFVSLEIAFKITTVLGIFLLPISAYFSFKLMKFSFPIPIFGALVTLPFLFMEANSMWGGNILSTLAGEFSYSLGFSLSILFIGSMYNGIKSQQHVLRNAILIALTGFSHGYTLLFAGLASLFFLITTEKFFKKLGYLIKVHSLGFCLMGLWILPLLFNLPNTTRYNFVWVINSLFEVLPVILIPFVVISVSGRLLDWGFLFWRLKGTSQSLNLIFQSFIDKMDLRIYYFWFCVLVGAVFYLIAYRVNVVDIRFLPFLQIFLVLLAAIEFGKFIQRLRAPWIFAPVLLIAILLWVDHHSVKVKDWVNWNYSGFEKKHSWPVFNGINQFIAGGVSDPRVVYEHASAHNSMGTLRAFESIPLFSGRSTLEGIYMQSSITSPFVFYIQSEISKEKSCPLPDYGCSTLNLEKGIEHLKLFNVKDFIVRSEEVKSQIKKYPEFSLNKRIGQYEIYELTSNENRYVVSLSIEPVLYETKKWKMVSYRWFKQYDLDHPHLVFTDQVNKKHYQHFQNILYDGEINGLPKTPVPGPCEVEEKIKKEEIFFKTTCIGKPHLIKISYHPNWEVEGASEVFLISPSFMLVFPEQEKIILRFSNGWVERTGIFLTGIGLIFSMLSIPLLKESRFNKRFQSCLGEGQTGFLHFLQSFAFIQAFSKVIEHHKWKVFFSICFVLILGVTGFVLQSKVADPNILYTRGLSSYNKENFGEARSLFEQIIQAYPETSTAQSARYYYAITFFKENQYPRTIVEFENLIKNYPESHWVPEALYHIGLCHSRLNRWEEAEDVYQRIIRDFPASPWVTHAQQRLAEKGTR